MGPHDDWLDRHTLEWVRAGIVSHDQADAIRHFEHLDEERAPQRLTVVAEVAIYLGSLIAFAGGAAIIGPNWDALGVPGQILLGSMIAAVGFLVGTWMVHQAEPGTLRLGSFLWAIGTGGVALATAVVVDEIDPRNGGWFPLVVGVPVVTIGIGLWRNLDRPLQLLTGVVGLVLVGAGVDQLAGLSIWVVSPVVWVVAATIGVLAASGHVRPRLVALVVAAAGTMLATFTLADGSERVSAVAAVLTAAGIVAFALADRCWPLVGVGLVAFFLAITMAMQTVLEGMTARLVAVFAGLVVVAAVAVRAQRGTRPTDSV